MGRDRSRSMSSSSSGRGAQSSKWDGQAGYRIHVSDLVAGVKREEIEQAFTKFGTLNEVWVATNPPCFAFINYKHRSDAEQAIRELDGKTIGASRVGVTWARTRTYGSRNVGGRSGPFGSFRAGGGGGRNNRRRSRSRSRSGSRQHKRRHSRSRSRDRYRRRGDSPYDQKRSRRTSREKSKKDDRDKSQSKSRSRSRSQSRKKSSNNEKKRSESRGLSPNGHTADGRSSPIATED